MQIHSSEGIAGENLEQTLHYLGRLGKSGFSSLNRAILETMLSKEQS